MKNHIYFGFLPYHTVGQTKLKIRSKAALYSVKSFIPWVFNERPTYISLVLYHKISTQWDVGERKEVLFHYCFRLRQSCFDEDVNSVLLNKNKSFLCINNFDL